LQRNVLKGTCQIFLVCLSVHLWRIFMNFFLSMSVPKFVDVF